MTEIEAYQPNIAYDAAGNTTHDEVHTYQYDAENRVVSVDGGTTASYKYDHQNRRVSKTVGSISTHYMWQGSQVIAEHDPATPLPPWWEPPYQVQSARVDYVYAGSRMVYSRQRPSSSPSAWTERYYLSDRLSTRLVLDATGNVLGRQGHLPFGEGFGESGTQEKHHFTSYERDGENGTDYAVNRQYSQGIGRFGRPDPYRRSFSRRTPKSLNRYAYVGNDPVNSIDPLGLLAYCPTGCFDPETGECNCPSTSGEPPSFDRTPYDFTAFAIDLGVDGNPQVSGDPNIDRLLLALDIILGALTKGGCAGLFNLPADTNIFDLLNSLRSGSGSITVNFADLGAPQNGRVQAAATVGQTGSRTVTLPDGRKVNQSIWIGATITINTNAAAPFSAGYGTPPRFGLDPTGNLAITIIHELGHAVARLYGTEASKIVEDGPDDDPDGSKSRANSQLIFDNCFK